MVKSVIIFLAIAICSCNSIITEDENLSLKKEANNSGALKLRGYYFTNSEGKDGSLITIYFLYNDGIIINVGTIPVSKWSSFESELTTTSFGVNLKRLKDAFGVYQISNGHIKFDMWYPGPGPAKLVYLRSGSIVNDSTFIIDLIERKSRRTSETVREIYHFKQFNPKPDSVNEFIK
jgi:hypothetical protein